MARIMLVDDTAFVRKGLRRIFEEYGYEIVAEATNGKEALQLYKQHKPDVVTLDITMPEMDGISTLKELKKLDLKAKVVMCTTFGRKDKIIEAIQSGASDYIIKPYQKERVLEAIEKQLDR